MKRSTQFCFFCLEILNPPVTQAAEDPAHKHVRQCSKNPEQQEVFVSKPNIEKFLREQVRETVDAVMNRQRASLYLPSDEFERLREKILDEHL